MQNTHKQSKSTNNSKSTTPVSAAIKKDTNTTPAVTTQNCSTCFKNLGVPSRMSLYQFIKQNGATSVSQAVDQTQLTQPTVSYHLKEMKESGLLTSTKKGKEVFYSLSEMCPNYNCECVLNSIQIPSEPSAIHQVSTKGSKSGNSSPNNNYA